MTIDLSAPVLLVVAVFFGCNAVADHRGARRIRSNFWRAWWQVRALLAAGLTLYLLVAAVRILIGA